MDSQMEDTHMNQRFQSLSPPIDPLLNNRSNMAGDNIRTHFDQVRNQYSVSKGPHGHAKRHLRRSHGNGSKLVYRSIEKPLHVYSSRPLEVVDVTDPQYRRDLKKLKKLQKLLAIQRQEE